MLGDAAGRGLGLQEAVLDHLVELGLDELVLLLLEFPIQRLELGGGGGLEIGLGDVLAVDHGQHVAGAGRLALRLFLRAGGQGGSQGKGQDQHARNQRFTAV